MMRLRGDTIEVADLVLLSRMITDTTLLPLLQDGRHATTRENPTITSLHRLGDEHVIVAKSQSEHHPDATVIEIETEIIAEVLAG